MLQGVKPSALMMPNLSHHYSISRGSKMDHYNHLDPWASWPQQQQQPLPPPQSAPQSATSTGQNYHGLYDEPLYSTFGSANVPSRHPELATPHSAPSVAVADQNPSPPPAQQRQSVSGGLVKPQPAFKPTWHGYLDTTKDAMTIVEAALQGRLSHISRRPHDKERAEMLVSGTVLVYEENASGIKRWTDAVHWSPSRVMNNCLIYRQLVRALKPEEKKTGLNASSGGKRKRKEDEFLDNAMFDGSLHGDMTPTDSGSQAGKVFANFAQNLTPEQQRRYCGSLVDSYEFKEGGLMKKTISVKFKGTHHHVISYYSLEDVVSGKLLRPSQDPKLNGIVPRQELLTGWKVSLDDEESKDLPLIPNYSQNPVAHVSGEAARTMPQSMASQTLVQPHAVPHPHPSLPVDVTASPSEYWSSDQNPHFSQHPQHPQHPPHQPPPNQQYVSPPPNAFSYTSQHPQAAYNQPTYPPSHPPQPFPSFSQDQSPIEQFSPQSHVPPPQHQYAVPQPQYYNLPMHNIPAQVSPHDHRRPSVPVKIETQQDQPPPQQYTTSPSYYRPDPNQGSYQPDNQGYNY